MILCQSLAILYSAAGICGSSSFILHPPNQWCKIDFWLWQIEISLNILIFEWQATKRAYRLNWARGFAIQTSTSTLYVLKRERKKIIFKILNTWTQCFNHLQSNKVRFIVNIRHHRLLLFYYWLNWLCELCKIHE